MTLNSRDRTPTPSPPVSPARPWATAAQRFLFAVALFFACVTVILAIAQLLVPGLVALGMMILAIGLLLAGVRKKPGKRERPTGTGFWSRLFRAQPDDPDPQVAKRHGHDSGESGTDEEAAPALKDSGPPGRASVPVMEPMPGPGTGTPSRPDPTNRNKPVSSAAVMSAESGQLIPDPPVFTGVSAPGQAPWHLPVGSAPSGLAADAARLGDLEVRAASIVGAGHRCEEPDPRQDAYALGRTPDGRFLIIAVADGVSQSSRSDLGARVAVTAATRELGKMLASGGMQAIDAELLYNKIVGEMLGTGRNRGVRDDDICSILIVAVIPTVPRPDGTRPIWTSWIGDVSLWIHRAGVLRRATGMEKTGLDRNALDAVLPFNPDRAQLATFELNPSNRVAVVTDGLSDSLSSLSGAIEFFTREWEHSAPHPAAFLHSLCYDGPGQTDDRTAVVVWCGGGRPPGRPAHAGRPT